MGIMAAVLFCILSLSLSSPAADCFAAGDDLTAPLSLADAKRIALEKNPSLQASRAGVDSSKAGVRSTMSAFLPRLDLREDFERTNAPPAVFTHKLSQENFASEDFAIDRLNDPSPISNFRSSVVLTQPIFNQGTEVTDYQAARVGEKISALALEGTSQGVLHQVEDAFFQVLLAQERLDVLDVSLRMYRAAEAIAEERHGAGMALKSDVLSARVQRISTEKERLQAEGHVDITMARLNEILGNPLETRWMLVHRDNGEDQPDERVADWIEKARVRRPEILIAERQREMARIQVRKARFRFLPSVNLTGTYEANSTDLGAADGDSWSLMASATLNLFNGMGDRARVGESLAEARRVDAEALGVEQQVEREVREAFIRLQTARKQLDVARLAVEQAAETQRILKERYEAGLALMVELLAAESARKETALDEARSRYELRLARSALNLSAGTLSLDGQQP